MPVPIMKKRQRAPGAGVKADDGVTDLERKQVRLDPSSIKVLTSIGNGNLSLGVREAARRLSERDAIEPFDPVLHQQRV